MIIRDAKLTDVESILKLWKELMLVHGNLDPIFEISEDGEEKFRSFLISNINATVEKVVKVAVVDGSTVGYMMGIIKQNPPVFKMTQFGEIMDACVTANFRRQHIGERIFAEMKQWFSQKGITRLDVNAAAKNPVSMKFWQKMGFQPYLNHMYSYLP
jgi:GNAT superfamily N-acetyltransferase